MELAKERLTSSWRNDNSPVVLGEIFSDNTSVAIWNRAFSKNITDYFEQAFQSLGLGVQGVFSMDSLKQDIGEMLPEHQGKQEVIEDIYLLSDMLTCLFGCNSVGLRIAPLKSAMCPSFHVDNIPVRMVCTYHGPGSEWLPLEALDNTLPVNPKGKISKTNSGLFYEKQHIQQMNTFDVGLLKGKAWDNQENMAAVHRSCQLKENQRRILLTLDPM